MGILKQDLKLNELYRHYKTGGIYMPLQVVTYTGEPMSPESMLSLFIHYSSGNLVLTTIARPIDEYRALRSVKFTGDERLTDGVVLALYYSFSARSFFARPVTEFVERVKHPKYDDRWVFRFELVEVGERKC